jgi:hypothetical protein
MKKKATAILGSLVILGSLIGFHGKIPSITLAAEESKPAGKPIIVETDEYDIGPVAAIGFAEDVHAVFDKTLVRFAAVWRGDFLDPDNTSDIALHLSNDRWGFPPVMPFSEGTDPAAPWPDVKGTEAGYAYKGIRRDKNDTPVIMYTFNGIDIEERFMPHDGDNGFRREILMTGADRAIRFLPVIGAHVDPIEDGFELNGAWETRIDVSNATHSVESIGGAWAALIYILTPVDGRIEIAQEVEW